MYNLCNMKYDLEKLRVSLLADNHIVNLANSAFKIWVNSTMSFPSRRTLKLANNVSETFGRLVMQSKKNRGPRTEPWRTPHVIGFCFE